ncbi:MAG: vitamin B12-dependent ribonucleotide reductase, partial [Bradyrhizobium sp.]
QEGKSPGDVPAGQQATKYLSRGLTRSRTDNLVVMRGGSAPSAAGSVPSPHESQGGGPNKITALSSHTTTSRAGDAAEGAVALKQEAQPELSPTDRLQALQWGKAGSSREQAAAKAERRAEAKAKGYEGEMCGECGNFTLVRNGTCMKCDTCGSTTGCS